MQCIGCKHAEAGQCNSKRNLEQGISVPFFDGQQTATVRRRSSTVKSRIRVVWREIFSADLRCWLFGQGKDPDYLFTTLSHLKPSCKRLPTRLPTSSSTYLE